MQSVTFIMTDLLWIIILVGLGLVLAYRTAQSANNREKTHSNGVANVFNTIASGLVAMVAPTVLCSIFFIHPNFLGRVEIAGLNLTVLVHAVVIAFAMILAAIICLIPYAILEKPYLDEIQQREDKGWTREDAEASGL